MKKILLNLVLAISIISSYSTVRAQGSGSLPATVVDIATSDSSFTTLVTALTRSDLTTDFVDVLSGDGPFTVFAPTNDAFAALLSELGVASLNDIDAATLEAVLKMHVVAGKVMSTDLTEGMMAPTLEGDELTFSLDGGASITDPNGRVSNITGVDVEAQNGVVHVIDKVILPDLRPETVVDIATADTSFTSLVAALTRNDLTTDFVDVLTGDGPFTVFAPTNDAFAALLTELGVASLNDIDAATLEAVLKMHVVAGKVMSTDLSEGMMAPTLEGDELTFSLEGGASITDPNGRVSNITGVDVEAQNGVVHVIDKVILPDLRPETVVDIATADTSFTSLVAALTRSDLTTDFVDVLSGDGPFTVFAPTNDAFAALLTELGVASLNDIDAATLEAVLKMHVVDGKVMSTDLTEGMMAPTLEGDELTFSLDGGASITDPNGRVSNITEVDVEAQNGVVHVIDKVILPKILPETVVDIATADTSFTSLVAALTRSDLTTDFVAVLSGDGPFTVFAPTNAAFADLLAELGVASLNDIDAATLEAVLKMHVVAGKVMSTDLAEGMSAATLQGEDITFSLDGGASVTDPNERKSNITGVDVEAKNGVVHVIDKVILPDLRPETVVDIAAGNENFSILVDALTREDVRFDFIKALTGKGPFTVFAPTNDAFVALLNELGYASLDDIPAETLEQILKTHIVAGEIRAENVDNYLSARTIGGQQLSFTSEGGAQVIDPTGRMGAVTIADLLAKNGVVHAIDKVLLPGDIPPAPKTVADIVIESPDHDTLEAAVVAAGLVETLQGDGPFTVFAPTDAAFAALPEGTLDALLADPSGQLTDILLYHVVAGKAMSSDLSDGQKIETVLGQNLTVTITSEGVFINGAQVTVADIEATNGVVHVIDAVLLPTTKTVAEIVIDSEDHNTLEAAVVAAGLVETLQGDGPFTVFAPTDAAFAALPEGTLDALLADPSGKLTDILLYHVVAGKAMSSDLSDGQKIETVLGQNLTVTITSEGVFINSAQVTVADIEATNGVVHVIDAVLLPNTKTVVDIVAESENHTILESALVSAGFFETLQGDGPFTVFAPTDAAFADLLTELGVASLEDIDAETLAAVLQMHVVPGKVMSSDLTEGMMVNTLQNEEITISLVGGVSITDPNDRMSYLTVADLEAANGVVHVIDKVILPDLTATSVDDLRNTDFNVYPNPVDDVLNIRSAAPVTDVKLMNLTGKVMLHRSMLSNNERIDVSSFSPGIYFVVVENEGVTNTKKIIIR